MSKMKEHLMEQQDLFGFELEHNEPDFDPQESWQYAVMADVANLLQMDGGYEFVKTELRKIGYDLDWYV